MAESSTFFSSKIKLQYFLKKMILFVFYPVNEFCQKKPYFQFKNFKKHSLSNITNNTKIPFQIFQQGIL